MALSAGAPSRDSAFSSPLWLRISICSLLFLAAVTLDIFRPLGKNYSIFYLVPAAYAAYALRGRLEAIAYFVIFTAGLIIMQYRPPYAFTFNRATGTGAALLLIILFWERRRYIDALQAANRDLEERVQLRTSNLTALNQEFKRLVDVRTQFLRNMSHEIRTPLNAIIGISSLLPSASHHERQELLLALDSSAKTMLAIVNNILDLSKIEAGRMPLHNAPLSIPTLIDDIVRLLSPEAARKNLSLSASTPPIPPLLTDPQHLRQILLNLTANAIKFTNSGFVRIELTPLSQTASSCRLQIAVHDSGVGIPPHLQPLLFQQFSQLGNHDYGGTGLGLAITKGLVDLLRGEITFTSTPAKGSTFTVTLSLPIASTPIPDSPAPSLAPRALPPTNILIVEDNAVNRTLVQRFVQRSGATATTVPSGHDALSALATSSYDLIFMDCHMPGLDGYQTTRLIRQQFPSPHIPIIAMTASVLAEDRAACFDAGMDDFLPKPFSLDDFQHTLQRHRPPA